MRSMFNRKSKVKYPESSNSESHGRPITSSLPNYPSDLMSEIVHINSIGSTDTNTAKAISIQRNRAQLNESLNSLQCKSSCQQEALSSSFSSASCLRRNGGVSVTFESTLPTQVWQASPNPSPPLGDASKSCSMKQAKALENRHRSAASQCSESHIADKWLKNFLSGDTGESSSSDDDDEDDKNISFISTVSTSTTCSSSENVSLDCNTNESVGKPVVEARLETGPSPNGSDSNSSLELRKDGCQKPINKPESNVTTVKKSIHQNCKTRYHKHCYNAEHAREKKRTNRKRHREVQGAARNNGTTDLSTTSSSSTSSSGMEEMEALGWDDKSIAQLTRCTTSSRRNKLVTNSKSPSKDTSQLSVPSSGTPPPNITKATVSSVIMRHSTEITWYQEACESQRSALGQPAHTAALTEPPHSCLLARRSQLRGEDNTTEGSVGYGTRSKPSHPPPHLPTPITSTRKSKSLQRLAIITTDYRPCAEWEQWHDVLTIRKGDYVSIFNQSLPAIYQAQTPELSHNTWVYVRRWCSDHLVATGPPGFVPLQYCRLLTSSEIIHLWQHTCQVSSLRAAYTTRNDKHLSELGDGSKPTNAHKFLPTPSFSIGQAIVNTQHIQTCNGISIPPAAGPVPQSRTRHLIHLNNYHLSLSDTSSIPTATHQLPTLLQTLPPPSGFGSGGSIGSETEDRDSGRGPSSGSEWGSGRGGSSNVTLDRNMIVEKTLSDTGLADDSRLQQCDSERMRNLHSAEESQLGWNAPDLSHWVCEQQTKENYSQQHEDSALNSPSAEVTISNPPPVTLTTLTNFTPVLELRPTGSAPPTFFATHAVNQPARSNAKTPTNMTKPNGNGPDILATSVTCTTVNEVPPESHDEIEQVETTGMERMSTSVAETLDPSYWEPYKTVLHVNENTLEKFTLV